MLDRLSSAPGKAIWRWKSCLPGTPWTVQRLCAGFARNCSQMAGMREAMVSAVIERRKLKRYFDVYSRTKERHTSGLAAMRLQGVADEKMECFSSPL